MTDAMRTVLLCCALGALVGCTYRPGSFTSPERAFSGERATVGCLDIAIERRADLPIGPVLAYQFANRCDHATTVDLRSVVVIGRNADGVDVELRPYDPRAEIRAVTLDGRKLGAESLAYRSGSAVQQLCVDVATLARQGSPQWLCLGADTVAVAGGVR